MTNTSKPTTPFEKELDFAFASTMDEVLELAADFILEARQSGDEVKLGMYLKLASRCVRCALEMYGDRLADHEAQLKEMN